jgi:hypothetical protein
MSFVGICIDSSTRIPTHRGSGRQNGIASNKFGIDLPNDNGEDHDYGSGLPHHRQVEQKRSTDKNFIAQPFPRGDSFLVCL